jgi:signal transduction histidine kinase
MKARDILSWRIAGLLVAIFIIVGLPYLVTLNNLRETQQTTAWVAHSNAVKAVTYEIAYLVRDSEAAAYRMLAGDGTNVTQMRVDRAGSDVKGLLTQLREMTRDNPDQQMLIGTLESSVNGRVTLMNQAIERIAHADLLGGRQSLRDAGDLFKINPTIVSIVQNEDVLLASRQRAADHEASTGKLVLAITALAQLLLLAIIVVASERQVGRRLVAETRESRAVTRSQQILHAVREPIALFDDKLNALLVNTAFSELYQMDGDEQTQPLAEIGHGAWSDSVLQQRLRDVLLRDRELWDYDMIQRTIDGDDRHVVVNARRLQEQESDAPTLLLTVSDITARALVEQKVSELNRQLEGKVSQISDVNRELEAFSYSVSHDLRAPLRHISGFARKLEHHLGEHVDEKAAHYIEVISSSAQRMAQLIDDLLVFSRLGRGALRLQAVDMQTVVEESRAIVESGVQDRRIVWELAPLPMVIGDENMLRTVWQNLLGNAVKYTSQRDTAVIKVSVQQGSNGDYEFTVADNGAGFDMQYADKLFGVFQRLHRASEFVGNGIGLANVRRIIGRHGGRVWAEAELGKGANFHFSLPATDLAGASASTSETRV